VERKEEGMEGNLKIRRESRGNGGDRWREWRGQGEGMEGTGRGNGGDR